MTLIDLARVRRGDAHVTAALAMNPPPRPLDAGSLAALTTERAMGTEEKMHTFQIRAPRALFGRVDALVGRLAHVPEIAAARQTKSLILRVALARGVTELEREAAKAERAATGGARKRTWTATLHDAGDPAQVIPLGTLEAAALTRALSDAERLARARMRDARADYGGAQSATVVVTVDDGAGERDSMTLTVTWTGRESGGDE
jgi:hypothetical protein